MIPQRVLVKGFLCYRDEQEVRFDGGPLWMLAGPNGSGKSTVFDAVTFALFGQHRGGRQNARELINKDSDGLAVEFDFLLDGRLFQARRTLKKKSNRSTRQIHRWNEAPEGGGPAEWEAVPDTGNDDGFTRWVREHIGLTYETFTSSVLLLQGKAEKLLAAEPAERFRVLAGIVDLSRYQQLHDRADARRRDLEADARSVEQQLEGIAEVTEDELQEVERRIGEAERQKQLAQGEAERLQRLEVQAERWTDLQNRLAEALRQWERAEGLLAQAASLERDWERLAELRQALPPLEAVLKERARLAEAEEAARQLAGQRQEVGARLEQLDGVLEQTRQKRDTRRQAIVEAEGRQEAVGMRLRELAAVLARVALCDRQRAEVARLQAELDRFPADLPQTLERTEQEQERLAVLSQALPHLRRLAQQRRGLVGARERSRAAAEAGQAARDKAEQLEREATEWTAKADATIQAHLQARERAVEARSLFQEAAQEVALFAELAGAKTCRHCGQPLTPAHYQLEKDRRESVRAQAEKVFCEADAVRQAAARAESAALEQKKAAALRLAEVQEQLRECRRSYEQSECDARRHMEECAQACRDLAEPFRSRVSSHLPEDWAVTAFPTEGDLVEAKTQVDELPAVRRRFQEARADYERWNALKLQAGASAQTLRNQEAELPPDAPALREEHARLEAEDVELRASLPAQRAQVRKEQDLLDGLTEERKDLSQRLAEKDRQGEEQKGRCRNHREAIANVRQLLPPAWREQVDAATLSALETWQVERNDLENRGVEAQVRELQGARATLEALARRKAELEAEQGLVPDEARCQPEQFAKRLLAARQEQTARELVLDEARHDGQRLADRRERRRQLQEQFRALDRQHVLYRTLVEKLGRKGLQLHLMRQAERGIVDFSNAILDRLSGGQFCLRLRGDEGGDAEQALRLEAYDRRCDQVFGLPFLSGSQRFRVAVSVALGVGQYASRQHRPIESVIIDEGFGCLDREGRQVMIQELQNLRSQLRCILLVSHQEEFAEAFAEGYHFELANGTTTVTRFQR